MYLKVSKSQVKDLSEKLHRSVKESREEKNMEFEDADLILSVELRDETKPSKTLMQYTRKQKEIMSQTKNMFRELLGSLKDGINKDLSDEKNKQVIQVTLDAAKEEIEGEVVDLNSEMRELFKDMLKDEDNKLMLFVKNNFIDLAKEVEVSNYKDLPDSIKEDIKANKLKY